MKEHSLVQGSPEWLAHRAHFFNASDAPAMMGCSPYETRSQLIHRLATGISPVVDAATQRRFDDGHRFEALARPLAEAIVGEDLYPKVGSLGKLSASFDGLTMADDVNFEHKSLNEDLRAVMVEGCTGADLGLAYRVQMEQQHMVSGAGKTLFMASKWNGAELVEERHCWYEPDPELAAQIEAGWAQLEKDVCAYVPTEIEEMPAAEVTVALPALFVHAKGEITTSNMKEYGVALAERLKSVRAIQLLTDQDFSNAKESAKLLRENIVQAKLAKTAMLEQTATVGEAARMIDAWCEDMRLTALQLENDVDREDKAKKERMVGKTRTAYQEHIQALEKEISPFRLPIPQPNFAEVLKGKRSHVSMQDGLDTALANAKIAADAMAKDYRAKQAWYAEAAKGHETLFADMQTLIQKPMEDFQLAVKTRVAAQVEKDEKLRQEAAAAAIAKPAVHPEQRADELFDEAHPPADQPTPDSERAPTFTTVRKLIQPAVRVVPTTPPSLTLGEIKNRLQPTGLQTSGEGLKTLGFEPAGRNGAALLFHEADYPLMLAAMVAQLEALQAKQAA